MEKLFTSATSRNLCLQILCQIYRELIISDNVLLSELFYFEHSEKSLLILNETSICIRTYYKIICYKQISIRNKRNLVATKTNLLLTNKFLLGSHTNTGFIEN